MRSFVLVAALLFAAMLSGTARAQLDVVDPEVERLLGLADLTVDALGSAQAPEADIILLPIDVKLAVRPLCRGIEAASKGYQFRYIIGGRFFAQKCPTSRSCVQILPCPSKTARCFEALACEGSCRRFTPCLSSTTTTTVAPTTTTTTTTTTTPCVGYRLEIVPIGFKLVPNTSPNIPSIKRVPCGQEGCLTFEACTVEDVRQGLCFTREQCTATSTAPNCLRLRECSPIASTTTTTTTTTTTQAPTPAPCNGIREVPAEKGYFWVLNEDPSVPAFKRQRCPQNELCIQLQFCTDIDYKNGEKCAFRKECASADGAASCLMATKC